MAALEEVKRQQVTHRQRQAEQTRQLIVRAARSLFASRGYAETSIEAVAEEAGVSPRTVYTVFGTKKALLAAICEAWLVEAGIPEAIAESTREPILRRRLVTIARTSRRQWELENGTLALLQGAAASDAEVARMLMGWQGDRAQGWHMVVAGLEPQLRSGIKASWAAAMIRILTTAEVYFELVRGEGWSPEQYEEWLGGMLIQLLLPAPQ